MWFHWYKVYYFDEFEGEYGKMVTKTGVTVGESIAKAMENISQYYGEKEIENVEIRTIQTEIEDILTEEDFPEIVAGMKKYTSDF